MNININIYIYITRMTYKKRFVRQYIKNYPNLEQKN